VPNWLRERLQIDSVKGISHTKVPQEVKDVVDSILRKAIRDGFELNLVSVEQVMQDAIEAFNLEVSKYRKLMEDANLRALDTLVQAGAAEGEIAKVKAHQDANKASWPMTIDCSGSHSALQKRARDFAAESGYSMFTQDKPTRHLPRDHPQVQHVNDFINYNIKEGQVDGRLVCNFDQVWSCLHEPMRRTLWKKEGKDKLSRFHKRQVLRASLQEHFGETVELPLAERKKRWTVKLADISGYGGNNTVNFWRQQLGRANRPTVVCLYSMYIIFHLTVPPRMV
jgi:hypothetical protein